MTIGAVATFDTASVGLSIFVILGFAALTYVGVRMARAARQATLCDSPKAACACVV